MQLSNDQQCMQERFDLICGKTSLAHNDQLEYFMVLGCICVEMVLSVQCAVCA